MSEGENLTDEYPAFLSDLKFRIRSAQVRAALSVNRELILLYWQIGRDILERQEKEGWGTKVIDRLSFDLRREFLLELGVGFAFVGSQYHLDIGGQDFYLDLLFYHLKLRSYVVIDLKIGDFIPEYTGKMNFYLSAVDYLLCHPDDKPTIGIILCKTEKRVIAEYALKDVTKTIGVFRISAGIISSR